MKLPIHFYKPLAIGAPQPMRELPVRPERMIHFFPPHIEKIRAKAPETARQCDVMCGNLEDAIPIESKEAARAGFIDLLSKHDFGDTGVWVRVNALNSPWVLDDIGEIIKHVGNKVDLIMLAGGSAASRVLDVMGERMVKRDFSAGIEARLHHKDFGLVLEAARKKGVFMPLTAAVGQQLNALMAQGWGRDDTSSLLRVLEGV